MFNLILLRDLLKHFNFNTKFRDYFDYDKEIKTVKEIYDTEFLDSQCEVLFRMVKDSRVFIIRVNGIDRFGLKELVYYPLTPLDRVLGLFIRGYDNKSIAKMVNMKRVQVANICNSYIIKINYNENLVKYYKNKKGPIKYRTCQNIPDGYSDWISKILGV